MRGGALPSLPLRLVRRLGSADGVLALILLLVIGIFAALPVGRLIATSIAPGGVLDLPAFVDHLARPSVLRATLHTLDTAVFGALVAFVIGSAFALATALTDLPGRKALSFLILLPLVVAPQVTALAWLQLVGPSSVLLNAIGLAPPAGTPNPLHGRMGIILLYGIQNAPIVFVTVRAGLVGLPRDLIEAARMSGSSALRSLLTVALPLARPYLVAALALAFVAGVGNFGIAALAGIPANYMTLTTLIYQRLASFGPDVLPEVAALSVLVGALALAGLGLQGLALGRRGHRYAPGSPTRLALGAWRWPLAALAWFAIIIMLVMPALALLSTSLVPAFGVPLSLHTATSVNFAEILVRQASTVRAFANSFMLAGGAGLILGFMAIPLAWSLTRRHWMARHLLSSVAELPYALPGVVIGIACILIFLRPMPLIGSLYGTMWIILAAYLMRFLALALRPVGAAMGQIPGELDEAAAMSGASTAYRLRTITAPMAAPAAAAGMLLVFLTAFNELTVSALLWSGGHETLGVVLFSLEEAGLGTQAAAIGVVTIVVVIVLLAVLDRLGRRLPAGVLPWR
ncbi:iron ABC transporter permease [Kaistia dalseonensis]|uniref:Iron(III) transport system permease protein n=1 Tax=Kaistia dalseonensis TaxID=410840 RepID=A0ABU0H137_9HYPH|nr:iron ABC transporter permease [Kaistia dalseonensis]MCX5493464.1 iron ABC transporter permease [Kaistia dalseonensis]MDQ0436023.1 iron(III) transport system permease protein [Kaistia dalseonensis]